MNLRELSPGTVIKCNCGCGLTGVLVKIVYPNFTLLMEGELQFFDTSEIRKYKMKVVSK